MKRMYKIIALILALGCLLSATAFATTYDEDDYIKIWPSIIPGDVSVMLKADVPEVEDYKSLFPELDIARFDRIYHLSDGRVELRIVLTELTEQASLDAVEKLQDNEYVETATTLLTGISGLWEDPPIIVLRGDLNNDNEVTNSDLVFLAQFIVYSNDNRAHLLSAADYNDDGFITNSDLVSMARKIVGLD